VGLVVARWAMVGLESRAPCVIVWITMVAAYPLPPARKLYGQLREHTTPAARAQAALDFIVRCTKSAGGLLFLVNRGELEFVAGSRDGAPPVDVISQAQRAWARELDEQPDAFRTKTVDAASLEQMHSARETPRWSSDAGTQYGWQLLSVYRDQRWCPVGLAMLELQAEAHVRMRQPYVESVCGALLDAGDVALG
jgi:hypothetical protein